jgi:electron transfer flavoprotein alpha subunit
MTVLVFVESPDDELSQQALTFARGLGDEVHAVLIGPAPASPDGLGAYGVSTAHVATGLDAYAPAAWAQAIAELIPRTSAAAVLGL